jgi:hypothetical protein
VPLNECESLPDADQCTQASFHADTPPKPSTPGKCPKAVHIFELELVGAFPTTGQLGTAASASLKYHMEETSEFAALPLYSCTGFLSSFLPFLMFKLRVLSATGAILDAQVRSKIP